MTYNMTFCTDIETDSSCFEIEVQAEDINKAEEKLQEQWPNGFLVYYSIVKEPSAP